MVSAGGFCGGCFAGKEVSAEGSVEVSAGGFFRGSVLHDFRILRGFCGRFLPRLLWRLSTEVYAELSLWIFLREVSAEALSFVIFECREVSVGGFCGRNLLDT